MMLFQSKLKTVTTIEEEKAVCKQLVKMLVDDASVISLMAMPFYKAVQDYVQPSQEYITKHITPWPMYDDWMKAH